ncbi:hypothetical protein D3C75_1079700 [compost metagenome]
MPHHSQSRANCSKAARLSSRCGTKVRLSMLRLKVSPDCRYTLARVERAKPSRLIGGSYHRPLNQDSR